MAWLCLGRRPHHERRRRRNSSSAEFLMHQRRRSGATPPPQDRAADVDAVLPRAADAREISGAMQELSRAIAGHVDTYITLTPMAPPGRVHETTGRADWERAVSAVTEHEAQMSARELGGFLVDARTRRSAAKYLMAWTLLAGIAWRAPPARTLLPPELASLVQRVPRPRVDGPAYQAAWAQWRVLSSFLLFPPAAAGAPDAQRAAELARNVQRIGAALDAILRPFYDARRRRDERDENVGALVRRAADFAVLLFAQPVTWSVQWEDATAQLGALDGAESPGFVESPSDFHRNMVVFPGLERVAGDAEMEGGRARMVKVLVAEVDRNIEMMPRHVMMGRGS